jgi:hypothetical protein
MENRIAEKISATKQPLFIINLLQMATLRNSKNREAIRQKYKTKRQPFTTL